jgi:hypothetical protein
MDNSIIERVKERLEDFLRNNPGKRFSQGELRKNIGITTASEDDWLLTALIFLERNEGFRWESSCGVTYYYYVKP